MPKEKDKARLDEFKKKCREHHLKITPQRVAIYRELMKNDSHPSTDMMFQVIRKELPNISFDTVNRTLLTLSEIGVIEVLEVQGGPRRYEPNQELHHHFYCQKCREIIDLFHSGFGPIQVPEDIKRRFEIRSSRIVLSGLCDKCKVVVRH